MTHAEPHPRRGETQALIADGEYVEFQIEDWADRVRSDVPEGLEDTVLGRIVADIHGEKAVALTKIYRDGDLQVKPVKF